MWRGRGNKPAASLCCVQSPVTSGQLSHCQPAQRSEQNSRPSVTWLTVYFQGWRGFCRGRRRHLWATEFPCCPLIIIPLTAGCGLRTELDLQKANHQRHLPSVEALLLSCLDWTGHAFLPFFPQLQARKSCVLDLHKWHLFFGPFLPFFLWLDLPDS